MSRPQHMPFWLPAYALLLALTGLFGGPLGVPALDIPIDDPAYFARGLGLSAVLLAAVWLRAPAAYAAGFLGCAIRETGDLTAQLAGPDPLLQAVAISAAILLFDLLGLRRALAAIPQKGQRR